MTSWSNKYLIITGGVGNTIFPISCTSNGGAQTISGFYY